MKTYKISTVEKKNIQEEETWVKDKKSFGIDQWWRWGYVTITVEDDEDFDIESTERNEHGFYPYNWEVIDRAFDDGVALFFDTNGDEELEEEVQTMWDDEGYSSFEQAGYDQEDCSTTFHGPLKVELIND